MNLPLTTPKPAAGWEAQLTLGYEYRDQCTVLSRRQRLGPLTVQRPFYPEGSVCHTYLLHPPGGVVGGDRLEVHTEVDQDAHALITAPGATKFYRSNDQYANARFTLNVKGALEWLPHETIFFNGARVRQHTSINLDKNACFIGWEINCLGRSASGESFDHGYLDISMSINCDASALLIDRIRIDPQLNLTGSAGLKQCSVFATALAYPCTQTEVDHLRTKVVAEQEDNGFAFTWIEDLCVVRYLGHSSLEAQRGFRAFWQYARPIVLQRQSCPPRIWNT